MNADKEKIKELEADIRRLEHRMSLCEESNTIQVIISGNNDGPIEYDRVKLWKIVKCIADFLHIDFKHEPSKVVAIVNGGKDNE